MAPNLSPVPRGGRASFQQIAESFLSQPGLPFAELLSAERIERIFAKHGGLFGLNGIYSTAVMVWSFLGQVLRDGKEASCQAAVARVVTHCQHLGQPYDSRRCSLITSQTAAPTQLYQHVSVCTQRLDALALPFQPASVRRTILLGPARPNRQMPSRRPPRPPRTPRPQTPPPRLQTHAETQIHPSR